MEKSPGRIITFYSYKGGAGRSMALANVGWVLASAGKRVLAVDWDLEAPGLHRFFSPFLVDRELTATDGLIDSLINYMLEAITPGDVADDWYTRYADLGHYTISLEYDFPDSGTLDFVPAGRQDLSYSTRMTSFGWKNFYDNYGGGALLEAVKERLRAEYDYVLIDSRTGVGDSAGICTVQMPDDLVVCFTLNRQSIEGAAAVAGHVFEQRRETGIRIFPVPMRVEYYELEKFRRISDYARYKFARFPNYIPWHDARSYWAAVEIPHIPFYSYEETLAAFNDNPDDPRSMLAASQRLAAYLTDGAVTRLGQAPDAATRSRILGEYRLGSPMEEISLGAPPDEPAPAHEVGPERPSARETAGAPSEPDPKRGRSAFISYVTRFFRSR